MTTRQRCAYCKELAVAYRVESDGTKIPICAYHIPVKEGEDLPELRPSAKNNEQNPEH